MFNTAAAPTDRGRNLRTSRRRHWRAVGASVALSVGLLGAGTTQASATTVHYPCGPIDYSTGKNLKLCVEIYPDVPPRDGGHPDWTLVASSTDAVRLVALEKSLTKLITVHSQRYVDGPRPNPWEAAAVTALVQVAQDSQGADLLVVAGNRSGTGTSQTLVTAIALAQSALMTQDLQVRHSMLTKASTTIEIALS